MSKPVKDTQEQQRLAKELLRAVKSKNLTEIFKALDNGADPRVHVNDEKGYDSAYSYLTLKFAAELSENAKRGTVSDAPFTHILREILLKFRIPIPENDAPWSRSCNNGSYQAVGGLRQQPAYVSMVQLNDGLYNYNNIKSHLQSPDLLMRLHVGAKQGWIKTDMVLNEYERGLVNKLVRLGAKLLACPILFRELISDETLWATRADAAAYMESVIALKRFDRVRPQDQWVNRLLESWQADTPLAKYARDETPEAGAKR